MPAKRPPTAGAISVGPWCLALLMALLATARPVAGSPLQGDTPWSVTGFVGQHDDNRFVEITTLRGGTMVPTYIAGAVVGYELGEWWRETVWELEAQAYHHHGLQSHWEYNAAVGVRWTRFPWNDILPTTFSYAQGLSLATEEPVIEDETRRFLHYLHAEFAVRAPSWRHLSVVARVHHRSGVFGLFGVTGGSNFLNLGLRYRY